MNNAVPGMLATAMMLAVAACGAAQAASITPPSTISGARATSGTAGAAQASPVARTSHRANRVFTATAESQVKGAMDHDSAVRAAKAVARAGVVAESTRHSRGRTPVLAASLAGGAAAMRAISGAVTLNEHWTVEDRTGGKRVRVRLAAQVKLIGGRGAPKIRAAITPSVVQSGKPFTLTLSSDRPCSVAVFGWTSDDLVLRAFPYGAHPLVRLEPGKPMTLPRPDANEQPLTSELRERVGEDFEALIIVASSGDIPYDDIAQPPGATVQESAARAQPIQVVFKAISTLPGDTSVNVVPYRVVAKP